MLSGDKRVAVKRIPSHELMCSSKPEAKFQGKYCGKLQTLDLIVSVLLMDNSCMPCKVFCSVLNFARYTEQYGSYMPSSLFGVYKPLVVCIPCICMRLWVIEIKSSHEWPRGSDFACFQYYWDHSLGVVEECESQLPHFF